MTYRDLKRNFIQNLHSLYDEREASQVFHLIMEDAFQTTRVQFTVMEMEAPPGDVVSGLEKFTESLSSGAPVQYVLGQANFDGHLFKVTPDVLIPRPETEELVQWISENEAHDARFIDVGSGSGCIQTALALRLTGSRSLGLDISARAIQIATENAERHQVNERCSFVVFDILNDDLQVKAKEWMGNVDFIVSNPPYIPPKDMDQMHPRVTRFEPHLALFSEDPLTFYRAIMSWGCKILRPGGHLYFELHEDYSGDVEQLMSNTFTDVRIRPDLQGKQRMIRGTFQPK